MTTKAVLVNLGVFLADNNIRRSIGSYSYNFTSPTASVSTVNLTLLPGQSTTWTTPVTTSSCTLVAASGGVNMSFTFALEQGESAPSSYAVQNSKLHFVDKDVRQAVIHNSGTSNVSLTIIQS